MVVIAIIVTFVSVLAQHLGLTEAMARVANKIAKCPKCCTFWCVIAVLLYVGCDALVAISLSVLMSYVSHYVGLLLMCGQKLYNRLWEKLRK